jgi:hypothetical protein
MTPTSTQEISSSGPDTGFELYPNPARDRFTLEFTGTARRYLRIQLYDITGKQVYEELADNRQLRQQLTITPGRLSKGIYLVKLSSGDWSGMQRLVIH